MKLQIEKKTFSFNVFKDSLNTIDFSKKNIINTINPHSYCVSLDDNIFSEALKMSDILLPDGIGIVLAERLLNGNKIKKIAGYDLFNFLMKKLNNENGSVFFLGASQITLNKIKTKCEKEFPNVKFASYSPPYKDKFSDEDSNLMCTEVNKHKPDVLFVGMTAPKQEKWVYEFQTLLNAKTICSIGAVFDFYAGNIKRSSPFWISIGLEWLPRLIKEPKRLFKRNFISTPKFIVQVLWLRIFKKELFKIKNL
jgi:N-acetylglucosaminyldiphosphoundecaprenol N-acetyl-beta-D-mannosaminyltransferase